MRLFSTRVLSNRVGDAQGPGRSAGAVAAGWVGSGEGLALAMAVVFAVLLASTLGLLHRTAHGLPGQGAAAKVLPAFKVAHGGSAINTAINTRIGTNITQLLPAHAAEADCLLFDQFCHTGSPAHSALPLPLVPVLFFFLDFYGADACVIWPAPFHARGPPINR